jgi:hypothetical protein
MECSLPYEDNDDTVQNHEMITQLQDTYTVYPLTKYGYPYDRPKDISDRKPNPLIDGIKYSTLQSDNSNLNTENIADYLKKYMNSLFDYIVKNNIGKLHAVSNYYNGLVGAYVSKQLGIEFTYEIRDTTDRIAVFNKPLLYKSDVINMRKELENDAIMMADRVIVCKPEIYNEVAELNSNTMLIGDNDHVK